MQSAKERYLVMSLKLFPAKDYEKLVKNSELDERALISAKSELLMPYDLKIVCAMLDEGYPLRDITDTLNNRSMFAKHLPKTTPEEQRRYADEVMGRVNEMRTHEIGKDYALAEEFYLSRAGGKTLNIAQEGDTVLSMLMEGFAPETVEKALCEHGTDEEYARALVLTCSRVAQIYKEIQTSDTVSEIRTAKDAYRNFAGEYMREHKVSKLDRKGDRDIVRRMLAKGWKEDFIRNALRFSPVAAEPWRDKGQYVDAVYSYVLKKQDMKKGADNRYTITASMYEEKINRLKQSLLKTNPAGINENREYYDGIAARELLEEHQLRTDIERVIAEKSPVALAKKKRTSGLPYLKNMRSAFFLSHTPVMDTRIAEAMLAQGFQAAAISAAMQKLSPCVKNDEQYGNSIMRSLEPKTKGFARTMESQARVRSLGV